MEIALPDSPIDAVVPPHLQVVDELISHGVVASSSAEECVVVIHAVHVGEFIQNALGSLGRVKQGGKPIDDVDQVR